MQVSSELMPKTFCASEYDVLKKVILCEPKYMTIREMINETQKHFKDEGLHIETAMAQHQTFQETLAQHGVEVIMLKATPQFPEQVFTRDIGFTLGQTIFVAEMAHDVRQGEEDILKNWLKQEEISYYNLLGDMIEGGDVIIDRKTIYIGVSNRTNMKAIEHMQSLMESYEVIAVPFHEKFLHLDCVFNIISPTEALYYPGVINKQEEQLLASRYELIPVTEEEQFTLATNVLSIGNKKILSLPVNKKANQELNKRGYEVIEVDITEIIKSGGSFRCCSLPLHRDQPS